MIRATALALVAALCCSCQYGAYFLRDTRVPLEGLEVRADAGARRECLVLLMPGMLDTPDSYVEHGFVDDALAASRRCDLLGLDAHFGYYRDGSLRARLAEVMRVSESRGYREIWIVGISMGGLGTLFAAQDHADRVEGVVLLAPFLGDEAVVRSVGEAGGLAEWDAPEGADRTDSDEYDEALWAWLRGYATHPDTMPQLYLGVGEQDSLRPGVGLLAAVIPPARHGTAEGGHDWRTWRVLWQRLMASPPWDPRGVPRIDR